MFLNFWESFLEALPKNLYVSRIVIGMLSKWFIFPHQMIMNLIKQFVIIVLNQITQSCSGQKASLCKYYEMKVRYVTVFSKVHKYWQNRRLIIANRFQSVVYIRELSWMHILVFIDHRTYFHFVDDFYLHRSFILSFMEILLC